MLDRLLVAEFHAGGELAKFILRHARHDGQAKFGILIQCDDVIILKIHAHAAAVQVSGVLQGVERVSCEARDFLCYDEVEHPCLRIGDHFVEVSQLLCGDAGESLIYVAGDESSQSVAFDKVFVVGNLIVKGVELLVALR